ncbi:MAG: histidine phosphatase family protein [Spirosomaceae bacterium]|nr:histidine phosphatase family protein [Spirosomataceae bacterium]MDP5140062.1 histidine phosphatase family protein [Spirosomataceae bacterium]
MKNVILLCLLVSFSSCQTTYYVVRHAEKATEPRQDPPLTKAGEERAKRLKGLMANKRIKQIYSSDYVRTKETARPTAEALNLTIESYNPGGSQEVFIDQMKASKKNTLIVGHSNTIRYVINGLTETETLKQDLEDSEYSNLFIIKRKRFPKKKRVFERLEF